ncbi:MAG TPA: cupredoxin domain-containing protein [Patescibacteria group bacterium]|nr:cupredoxin domain-containing protein [Patescibacteria group bacterium]
MNKNLLALIVGVALLGGGYLWWTSQNNNSSTTGTPAPGQSSTPETSTSSTSTEVTLTYTDSGFSPLTLEVKSGGKLTVVNNSTRTIDFASNSHPIHTDNTDLNFGVITPNKSKQGTLTKKGSWRYHDHLNASAGGQVIVF